MTLDAQSWLKILVAKQRVIQSYDLFESTALIDCRAQCKLEELKTV